MFATRVISLILIAFMAAGCSQAIDIPRSQIGDPAYREPGSYRIRVKGREEYLVRRFSVTDSTVVIEELMPADERYRFERAALPMTVPRSNVSSIVIIEAQKKTTFAVLVYSALAIGAFVSLVTSDGWAQ